MADRRRLRRPGRSAVFILVTSALFLVSGLLLIYLLKDMDWMLIGQAGLRYLPLVLALAALGTLCYTLVIWVLVTSSGHQTSFVQAYLVLTASLTANYVTPVKIGIPLRVYLYHHLMQIPVSTGSALIAAEAVLGMTVPAVLAALGIATLFPAVNLIIPLVVVGLLAAGVAAILLTRPDRLRSFLDRFAGPHRALRAAGFLERVQAGLRRLPLHSLTGVTLLIALMLFLQALNLHLVLRTLGQIVSPIALLYVLAISVTAGNLSLIPMGIGVRDASFVLLLRQLGIPDEIALSAAVIQRLLAPGWPLLLGIISTNILGIAEVTKGVKGLSSRDSIPAEDPASRRLT
jgi:uncharacterized protein (TIRG00374 family)